MIYPEFSTVLFEIGVIKIRWYGVMYIIGFVIAFALLKYRAARRDDWDVRDIEDLIFYGAMGVILGGRIGYVLFYQFDAFLDNPLYLFKVWDGGMSFHGGLLGVLTAIAYFARKQGRGYFEVSDFLAPATPWGLFFGRIGNFINGELWGKPTDVPWGFIVNGQKLHASQLYEAFLEGLVLFCILWWFSRVPRPRMAVSGLFLMFYGVFRFAIEFVRVPDADPGYIAFGWVTMGQILSTPMIVAGLTLVVFAYRSRPPTKVAPS
ncbi:MAG: prolipoprotein diacylglyceryl transferase [Pseudomonadota bacterium]